MHGSRRLPFLSIDALSGCTVQPCPTQRPISPHLSTPSTRVLLNHCFFCSNSTFVLGVDALDSLQSPASRPSAPSRTTQPLLPHSPLVDYATTPLHSRKTLPNFKNVFLAAHCNALRHNISSRLCNHDRVAMTTLPLANRALCLVLRWNSRH